MSPRSSLVRLSLGACLAATVIACGPKEEAKKAPVQRETAADEILRIGEIWQASVTDKGFLSPPSQVALFKAKRSSEVTFSKQGANEVLVIEEIAELRDGGTVRCKTSFEHALEVRYGHRQGEAAVELIRPPLSQLRSCDRPHPQPMLSEAAVRALFVLRSDQLIVVEPALDDRAYIPKSY